MNSDALDTFLTRATALLDRLEPLLPVTAGDTDWSATAYQWRKRQGRGWLHAVHHPHSIRLDDLQNVELQKSRIEANTRQFVAGRSANNVLLTGARGTGKSSLVKGVLQRFAKDGLRLIEVDKADLVDLPEHR